MANGKPEAGGRPVIKDINCEAIELDDFGKAFDHASDDLSSPFCCS
jgi:hypothetical protein